MSLYIISGIASILAGIIHVALTAPHHIDLWPESIFFAVFGLLQIIWGVWFVYKKSHVNLGIVLNTNIIVLAIITRLLPAPFMEGPEGIDTTWILAVLFMLVGVLAAIATQKTKDSLKPVVAALLLGIIFYGTSLTVAAALPELKGHGHEENALDPGHTESAIDDHDSSLESEPHID